jgi:hypothetical protein
MASFGRMTVDDLIESVKARAAVPISQNTFQSSHLIRFLNEEIDDTLVPLVLQVKEEFYVSTDEIALVSGQTRYSIPYRAIGSKIRNVYLKTSGGTAFKLSRVQPEDVPDYQYGSFSGDNHLFYIEGDSIVLVSQGSAIPSGSLMVSYYMKPNDLVASSRVCQISSITEGVSQTTIIVDAVPSVITTATPIDFIGDKPNHRVKGHDIAPVSVSSGTATFVIDNDDIPDDLEEGDHIALAGETHLPQVPSDLHVILAQAAACRVYEAQADVEGLKLAKVKLDDMLQRALEVIDTRTEGNPQKIFNSNSLLRRGRHNVRRGNRF